MSTFSTTGCFDPYCDKEKYKQMSIVFLHFNKQLQNYSIMLQESDHTWLRPLDLRYIFYLVSYKNKYMSKQPDDRIYMFYEKGNKMCKAVSFSS